MTRMSFSRAGVVSFGMRLQSFTGCWLPSQQVECAFYADFPGQAAGLFMALIILLSQARTALFAFGFQAKPVTMLHQFYWLVDGRGRPLPQPLSCEERGVRICAFFRKGDRIHIHRQAIAHGRPIQSCI